MNTYSNEEIKLTTFLELESDGVFYTGHASIIVRINKYNFLFDYVKNNLPYGKSWRFFPELTKNVPMDQIDGIFVSHIHQDHFDPVFLSGHDISCPIYILEGRPSFEEALKKESLDFVKLACDKKIEILPDVYVYGFTHQNNGVDASCCIGNKNFSVYHGNDNYLDNQILDARDSEFQEIDVACIPYAYINWYPQLLENISDEMRADESNRLCVFYYEYAVEQANSLRAKQVIPFGANLVYRDSAHSRLNSECKTPLDFEEYIRATRGDEEAKKFKALFSGDTIIRGQDGLVVNNSGHYSQKNYRDKMDQFLSSLPKLGTKKSTEIFKDSSDFLKNISIKSKTTMDHYIGIRGGSESGVMINTKTGSVDRLDLDFLAKRNFEYHILDVKSAQLYNRWLTGDVTIEQIIGSRKFTMTREPNNYNKEILVIMTTEL